jgi:sulfite exporter TauE/SafE
MSQYVLIFLAGAAGSFHCVGMCGGFACALGSDPRGPAVTLFRHLVYNLGRVMSYCFLGAVVGYLGVLLVGHGGEGTPASLAQRTLAVVSGLLMVFIGLQFFGFFRRLGLGLTGIGGELLVPALRDLLKTSGIAAPLAFGVLNGFLPCPLVYAFAAQAAGSGDPASGFLTMAAFGLGTFPAMLMMGGIGIWWRRDFRRSGAQTIPIRVQTARGGVLRSGWREHGMRVAGGFIVVLGLITLARGVLPMSAHVHGL